MDRYCFASDGTDANEAWCYDHLGIKADFAEQDDYRLGTLQVYKERYHLNGAILIGKRQGAVLGVLEDMELGPYEKEDLGTEDKPTRELVSFDRVSLNLWFSEGKLESIQWSPFWDGDVKVWPQGVLSPE